MSSSSDEDVVSLSQALPVPDIPANYVPPVAPSSAEEYLQYVVWEAKNCPKTVSVDIDRSKLRPSHVKLQVKSKANSPASYIPTKAMQDDIMKNFTMLVSKIRRLKQSKDIPAPPVALPQNTPESWCEFCLGRKVCTMLYFTGAGASKSESDTANEDDTASGQKPLLSIVLNIDPKLLEGLFTWNLYWLENFGFSYSQGQWLYSLLALLEKPILPDLYSILREIIFRCAKIRADLDSSNHPHLQQLNTIICIIAKGFEQSDLID